MLGFGLRSEDRIEVCDRSAGVGDRDGDTLPNNQI
jgi:hypothetical protein